MKKLNKQVFINCPFDDQYEIVFHAIIFTIFYCKYDPRCALQISDGTRNRLDNIFKMIASCKFGIHDISRVESNRDNLPRFNMPFEYGVFLAARKFGAGLQKKKVALILEKEKFLYQSYFSDISGIDPKAHNGDYKIVINEVRNWLYNNTPKSDRTFPKLGTQEIVDRFEIFYFKRFPEALQKLRHNIKNITYKDYCNFAKLGVIAQTVKDNKS